MIALPLVLVVAAAALTVWMLHTATVYALPLVAGGGAAALAFHSGSSLEGAAVVGVAVAIVTFASMRFILAQMPAGVARSVIAFVLILPSLILGYNIGLDVLEDVIPSEMWRHAIAISYALLGGWVAFVRLTEIDD